MASRRQLNKLQKEFPELDLTQSALNDVLKYHDNDRHKAVEVIREMKHDLQREKEQKIQELKDQFTALSTEEIVSTLELVNWDVDAAILPLFNKLEQLEQVRAEQRRKQREEEQKKQPKPAEDSAHMSLSFIGTESQMKQHQIEKEIQTVIHDKESPFKLNDSDKLSEQRQIRLSTKSDMVDTGNPITVEWELLAGKTSPYDWIGLYAADQPNKSYLTYEWRGTNEQNGTITFTAPKYFGMYEFRYIPYGSYEHVAKSNQVRVGPYVELAACHDDVTKKIKVNWVEKISNVYPRAWVGLYEKNQPSNRNYLAWEYCTKPYTEATFNAPIKPGEYEFRYFPFSYVDVARSNTVVISGNDTVEAVMTNDDVITAKVSVVTVDPYYDSVWIGLYLTSETNNKKMKRYRYISERTTQVAFRNPGPGQYEIRLFAHKNYEKILSSNPITIPADPQQ